MSFESAMRKFEEKTQLKIETAYRKIALSAFTEVVMMSPVDTGRFRGNWQCSVDPRVQYVEPTTVTDPSGGATVGHITSVVSQLEAGETIWLINNLPYARRLEYGWSKQAPAGMVRVTAQRWTAIVNQVAKEVART